MAIERTRKGGILLIPKIQNEVVRRVVLVTSFLISSLQSLQYQYI